MVDGRPRSWRELVHFLEIEEPLNDDWQARQTIRVLRVGQWLGDRSGVIWVLPRKGWWLVYNIWVQSVIGADLPPTLEVGPGLRLPHGGRGVVLHPRAVVGARVTIYHGVTVGMRGGSRAVPTVGDDVVLGAGAVIVGGVTIGDGAAIGPNAVVVNDVAPGAHVVASAPVVVSRRRELSDERRSNRGRVLRRLDGTGPGVR